MTNALLLLSGLALLTLGGEALIRGSLAAANRYQVSPLLTGLFIVGFGTSAPELVVSVDAALRHQPDIAVGNVVGSNIGNVLFILGLCALITPLKVRPLALRRDALTVIAASLLFLFIAHDSLLNVFDAGLLLVAFFAYLIWAYQTERSQSLPSSKLHIAEAKEVSVIKDAQTRTRPLWWIAGAILIGLSLLIIGSRILLSGAVGLAHSLGISEAIIGLTIVAIGTSLPELSVSLIAAIRKHADVAVGNILGSNIFNLLGILGVSTLLQPLPLNPRMLAFDQWVLVASALLIWVFLYTGRSISRGEGLALLVGYGFYLWVGLTLWSQ